MFEFILGVIVFLAVVGAHRLWREGREWWENTKPIPGGKRVKITDSAGVHYFYGEDALDEALEYMRSRPGDETIRYQQTDDK